MDFRRLNTEDLLIGGILERRLGEVRSKKTAVRDARIVVAFFMSDAPNKAAIGRDAGISGQRVSGIVRDFLRRLQAEVAPNPLDLAQLHQSNRVPEILELLRPHLPEPDKWTIESVARVVDMAWGTWQEDADG